MRVVHLCLAGPYNDGWTYQENMLVLHHCKAGHDVTVVEMPFTTDKETGKLCSYSPGRYTDSTGVRIIRLPLDVLLQSVRSFNNPRVKVVLFGSVMPDSSSMIAGFRADSNVHIVGWADAAATTEYFLAGDLTVFPGTQSALWAQAVGCGIPCVFSYWRRESPVDLGGNVVFLETGEAEELTEVLREVCGDSGRYSRLPEAALSDRRRELWYCEIA